MAATRTEQQVATTPLFEDQIRSYRRNQRRLYNTQQAARRIGRQLTGGGTTRYTLEQQLEPEAQLQLSMQERASIVPAEVLYHSRRDDAHHRVYVHRSEEAILVTDNHQVDRNFIQEESFAHLQRSRMQYIHLGVLQVRIQILHRQYEGTMALVVFRDNRWQGDQAILATMEVDLTRGSQMIYVIPEVMMTIGDFYRNIQISILTRGYEAWQNSEANLLITRGMVGRLSNTPNVGFAYEVQGVVDYLTSHGVNALPGRRLSTRSLQGLNWVINPTQISIPMQPVEVNSQTMMDGRISLSFNNYTAATTPEQPKYNDKDEEILAVWIETKPGVHVYYDGEAENYYEEQKLKYKTGRWDTLGQPSGKFDYYVNYDIPEIPSFPEIPPTGWDDEVDETNNSQKEESIAASERYSSTTEPHILINKISPNAVTPSRQSEGSAGVDISASHAAVIEPNGRDLIHTGLRIEIPYGYYGRLASRSGLAWKTGIEVGAGVIDSDYRGEVQVLLFNRTNLPIYIFPQQKIAQLILEKIAIPEVYEVPHLSHTERGSKGFGSTEAQNQKTLTLEKNPISQDPRYFTSQDIFALLMPKETTAVLVQDDSFQSNFEQDHAVDTSPGAAVPRSMDPTLNYQDLDDSYLDYIQYLSTLSRQQPPQWDSSPNSKITGPTHLQAKVVGGKRYLFN
ncbi:hypothetical protein ZIOFF_001587 [Zingiber officinale]|uniref:dUTP diphosphatase n=1 Tax=Zingiber officinale TaxID=94328 RepID=A0A8J5I5Z2_ZINOF|nr:hypothetical protein ZIOFF_001587 [Zingiber officinale]